MCKSSLEGVQSAHILSFLFRPLLLAAPQVKLLDIIQAHPGGLYLVFEFVTHDLKTFMDQHQKSEDISERVGLPLPTVRSFLRQIIAGVGCCHTYRILHRDLKPHNVSVVVVAFSCFVLVLAVFCSFFVLTRYLPPYNLRSSQPIQQLLISGDGKHVKLADFGLARLSAIPNGPYTFEVVTLWYRAPELLLGANRYSTSVDVWSIGCIFAEMATGMPLFPGRSDIDQLFKIFQRRGTPTAEVWPAVVRLPHYNVEFPQWRERPLTEFITPSTMGGVVGNDLLNKLLQYDPDRRIACKTALQHPFFLQN